MLPPISPSPRRCRWVRPSAIYKRPAGSPQTGGIIAVRGVRETWDPQPVRVRVEKVNYLRRFGAAAPQLANAFHLHGVPYRWERGKRLRAEP